MRELKDLGLTLKQMEEVMQTDPLLVSAWLDRVDDPMIDNPTAWFLTGIRSGIFPHQLADQRRAKAIHRAERWTIDAGCFMPDETNYLSELFDGPAGMLRHWRDEEALKEKMLTLYRLERPEGERVEREFEERAARIRASRKVAKDESAA
jgi:hypothetical protein